MPGCDRQVNAPDGDRTLGAHSATRVVYFHHVGQRLDHYTSISTDGFRRALDVLSDAAQVIDIREYLRDSGDRPEYAGDAGPPPAGDLPQRRRVVITIDDGYAETLDTVLDILGERSLTACFFVVPSWFGARAPHRWAPRSLVCADASALADAQDRGHAIASHTWSHQHLDRLTQHAVEAEVSMAAAALREHGLGVGVEGVIAYPYGVPPGLPAPISAGFCTDRGSGCVVCSPHRMRRVYLHSTDHSGWRDSVANWW
jgi:peptidoglycan/xylan/chitin deacetylase (PgdA/CDA1 family)